MLKEPENSYETIKRLRKSVKYATHAENWNQGAWAKKDTSTACGTSFCLAGFIATKFVGGDLVFNDLFDSMTSLVSINGEHRLIEDVAREWLGVSQDDASALFNSDNDADELNRIKDEIISELL